MDLMVSNKINWPEAHFYIRILELFFICTGCLPNSLNILNGWSESKMYAEEIYFFD